MCFVGVNVGALTVKVVALQDDARSAAVVPHQGRPLAVLKDLLAEPRFAGAEAYAVSGQLGHLSEAAALQRALREVPGGLDAVASLGGESFLVYILTGGRITNVLSHNKCAAGSGEFFVQQIGRMGLEIGQAIERSSRGKVVPLASRCSVHCKSDITHKLNRNEASPEDILCTLHDGMAAKVVALMQKGQRPLHRVLLIGGMTRNAAMVKALGEKLPGTELVVLPESAWFEAWGSALLARDEPIHKTPKLSILPSFASLPPLSRYAGRVQVIAAPPLCPPPDGPLVLGVDAGSTTTKAALIDPSTRGLVAAHYTRTQGDPVAATRECLRALAGQIGNRPVGWVGTTGSARELIGAYLGTVHVYNEISAHAAGAVHFDPEVDTIFEIGGQDAKYILLRNGVPVDYAMNNACSAGTGSFLEESAHGDLGIGVSDIAGVALAAAAPVHFKATCAAFINSDIRAGLQQGHSRDDIAAGLVYAIAENYVTRVKGPRSTGRKVFLQGGVALNHAVGHAIAHSVGRPVVIPPRPELLGALGVALLTAQRAGPAAPEATDLLALQAPELKLAGRFTCGACTLCCSIDRFEVRGRRFPFGGRCSLYENVWKRKARSAAAPDLVERRAQVLFDVPTARSSGEARPIGIPRALTTHSLYPLYATFLSGLGMDVVLSGVDPGGELKANSAFCFPAQIAHGAVLDLARQGIRQVFLPHVARMPQPDPGGDSQLCPITQAGPYFLAKAFPDLRLLSPRLDFTRGYASSPALVEMAVSELGVGRPRAEQAWSDAVRAQTEAEQSLQELGRRALGEALAAGKPAILLAGHSYNAFTREGSQSVGKKLSSMGVTVIPADCLAHSGDGPTPWHFANQVMHAVSLAKQHANLFLLCVSNFSCTMDAFTNTLVTSEMGAKPYLILEIDAHTADAGVQTRLEAFLDIIGNYRQPMARPAAPPAPCRLGRGGQVIRSNGERVPLTDPRVKLYFSNFSSYHAEAFGMAARWLGLHPGAVRPLERSQLDRGLQHTSGRECLPLPLCVGQLLDIHERRGADEISGFFMFHGGAPCILDAYQGSLERFIANQHLPDLFLFEPRAENDFLGLDPTALATHLAAAIATADVLVEIEQVLRVVGTAGAVDQLRAQWQRLAGTAASLDELQAGLPALAAWLAALPRKRDPRTCPRVVVTGDFFTRFSPFFMEGVSDLYAARGIVLKPDDLGDLLLYGAYYNVTDTALGWGMKPGGLAMAKACTRIFQPDGRRYVQQLGIYQVGRRYEARYRKIFRHTGLLVGGANEVAELFEKSEAHVSPTLFGEITPTVGRGLSADGEGYDGVIIIGPFNCLAFRASEAILKPLSIQHGMPILTYESDGYPVLPSFLRQVEVHIQQVLQRSARGDRSFPPQRRSGSP